MFAVRNFQLESELQARLEESSRSLFLFTFYYRANQPLCVLKVRRKAGCLSISYRPRMDAEEEGEKMCCVGFMYVCMYVYRGSCKWLLLWLCWYFGCIVGIRNG